jgi:hypothetical protein
MKSNYFFLLKSVPSCLNQVTFPYVFLAEVVLIGQDYFSRPRKANNRVRFN